MTGPKFEKVKKYEGVDFPLPYRKTKNAAGYDFEVIEDIIIPPYDEHCSKLISKALYSTPLSEGGAIGLKELADYTKSVKARPTLVTTGVKCYLPEDSYLELTVRSSTPLKYWLICANSKGIIDADYVDNPDNEGEIFFQLINLSPFPILIKKGDIVGQGIIHKYEKTIDDLPGMARTGGFGSTTK